MASDASHEQWAKFLSLLTEVVPNLSRVGVIGRVSTRVEFAELDAVSRMLNVSFEVADIQRPEDLDSAFETIVNKRVEALLVVGSPLVYFLRKDCGRGAQASASRNHKREAIRGGGSVDELRA